MRISDWSSDVCSSDLAEAVPFVRLGRDDNAIAQLRGAGFGLAATVVRGGEDVFAARLPQRLVYVLGAEGEGMDAALADACDLRLSIPGSGAVESLNVAAAPPVLLAPWAAARLRMSTHSVREAGQHPSLHLRRPSFRTRVVLYVSI